ncbi:MAG TPA: ABC transporter substrate-binding protein [Xanthobacteraceae bacterium]|jgi:NitT/TauT family transport system substrate-binding protein
MSRKAISKRRLLRQAGAVAALAVLPLPRPARAQTKRHVGMRLDWLYQGPNAGFMIAQEKGFYDEAGLNVEIGPGKGSGSTAQLVGSKAAQFGFADGYVVGNSVAKGMNIRMVAGIYRRNPTAVIVLEESGIKAPKDLEGKTVASPTGGTQFQQWPAFVKGCGLDAGKIRLTNIDPAGSPPALITGQVDAIAGYAQGYVPSIEIRGNKKARILWYSDCGVTAVSNGIIVHADLIKEDPDLIRTFVAASLKGFLYGRTHVDELAAIVKKFSEATLPAISRREAELSFETWVTPSTAGKPLGWMSEKDWQETISVLKQYGGVTTPLEPAQLFTNEFVPMSNELVPPQSGPSKI